MRNNTVMELEQKVLSTMREYDMLQGADRIVVGVSGGADSVCLLCVLRELSQTLGIRLLAVHVNHGLREAAAQDEAFVRSLCDAWGIPLSVRRPDVKGYAERFHCGTEEAGHVLRRQIFMEEAERLEKSGGPVRVALAHHMEDRVETMLFHLARGTGLRGLTGMLPAAGRIIRPLLEIGRKEIEAYLRRKGISWCTDETNADPAYARNRLRLCVLPELEKINPAAVEHCCRLAKEAEETEQYLSVKTEEALAECIVDGAGSVVAVRTDCLQKEAPLIQSRILYRVLEKAAGKKKDLSEAHIRGLLHLARKQGSGQLDLPYSLKAVRSGNVLALFRASGEPVLYNGLLPIAPADYHCRLLPYEGEESRIPRNDCTKWFDYDKIQIPVAFRTRESGDYITISPDGQRKSVARYMIDAHIPAGVRDRMVLPVSGKEVLWIPGGRISAGFLVDQGTERILELSLKEQGGLPRKERQGGIVPQKTRQRRDNERDDLGTDSGRKGNPEDQRTGGSDFTGL